MKNTNKQTLLKLDEQERFTKIETGAKFPVDASTYEGKCECCDRGQAKVAQFQIKEPGGKMDILTACAECYADFASYPTMEIRFLTKIIQIIR